MVTTAVKRAPKGKTKDYSQVAARIERVAEQSYHYRFLIYGRNKKGKTTFGISAGVDKTLVLDAEKSTKLMRKKNPHVLPVTRWQDLDDFYGFLRTQPHGYEWVVLDNMTRIHNMALKFIVNQQEQRDLNRKPGQVSQPDHGKAGELTKSLINNFEALPMNVVYIAQERMVSLDSGDNDDDDESTYFVPDLPQGARSALNSAADVIGRIYTVKVDIKGQTKTQRRLQIGPHERYDTGYRSEFNPPDMLKNPTIPKLISVLHGEKAA